VRLPHNIDISIFDGDNKYGIPAIKRQEISVSGAIPFNYVMSSKKGFEKTVHCFLDDYQIERLWNRPEKYINHLKKFSSVCSPDYSLYLDMPPATQIFNTYRSRWCGRFWQENGLNVIPTISWSDEKSFEFCFMGIEKRSTIIISSMGVLKSATRLFRRGFVEMIERIEPKKILWYGNKIDGIESNLIQYLNPYFRRFEDGRTRGK